MMRSEFESKEDNLLGRQIYRNWYSSGELAEELGITRESLRLARNAQKVRKGVIIRGRPYWPADYVERLKATLKYVPRFTSASRDVEL